MALKPRFRVERNELNEFSVSYKIGIFGMRWYIKETFDSWRPFGFSTRREKVPKDRMHAALQYAREEAARDIKSKEDKRKRSTWTLHYKEP